MKALRDAVRVINICRVLIRHGLDEFVFAIPQIRPVAFMYVLLPWNWGRGDRAPRARRVRQALEELGPIFVKFGQTLSTRRDLLPNDIADELAGLQDQVPPFPGSQARIIVESALGESVSALFSEFQEQPLASASIAQVHAATLLNGRKVVVKVVRPGIETLIRRDVELMHTVARLAERYWKESRRLRPREVVREYETIILDELDMMREAASASQLGRNFKNSALLYVPEIIWRHTRTNVLVMERVSGIPISDIDQLQQAGVDVRALAERGVEIFFTQVVRDNFFHADMHPGNIFVSRDNPAEPRYVAVDFGIMGSLTPKDRRYLAENFIAFFNRDYHRVAELHVQSRWVPAHTRINDFEAAIRSVCEPIFERPLKDISFGHLLLRLFQTARRFDMEVQPQLVLLQKTLLNIEGLGRQLYPDLDLWLTAKPFLEDWMKEQLGVKALVREFKQQAPYLGETLPRLPALMHEVLAQAREGRLEVSMRSEDLEKIRREIKQSSQRAVSTTIGCALVITAGVIYGLDGFQPRMLAGAPLLSWLTGGAGLALLMLAWPDGEE